MRKVAIIFMKKCSVLLLMLLFPLGVLAQSVTVSGQVTDEAGEPIIGASVRIPGTSVGVVTDMDGNYSISVPKGKQLEITYVGYKKEVIIAKEGKMTVQLKEDSNMLNEVVAIGYGTVKRKDVTGSVSSVESALESGKNAASELGTVYGCELIANPHSEVTKFFDI